MVRVNVIHVYKYRAVPTKMALPRIIDDIGEVLTEAPKYDIERGDFSEVVTKRISLFTAIKMYGLQDVLRHLIHKRPYYEKVEHW